jgi:hypothetical protein
MCTLRGRGMRVTKVLVCLFGATALAVCAWGMSTTDPGIVNGAFGVVAQVRVSKTLLRMQRAFSLFVLLWLHTRGHSLLCSLMLML